MEIKILSRYEMAKMLSEYQNKEEELLENFKVISIFSSEGSLFQDENQNLLCLDFDDITPDYCSAGDKLFNEEHAMEVVTFLSKLHPHDRLVVHCAAGISRSGAIGTFAARLAGQSVSALHQAHPRVSPNPWVIHVLEETHKNTVSNHEYRMEESTMDKMQSETNTANTGEIETGEQEFPEHLLELEIKNMHMDVRAKRILLQNKIRTIGQLKSMSLEQLGAFKGMGETTLVKIEEFLESLVEIMTGRSTTLPVTSKEREQNESILLEIFHKWLEQLKDVNRAFEIMMKRWGGYGRQQTLEEIGAAHEISKEYVRILTDSYAKGLRHLCGNQMREKIQAMLAGRKTPLYLENIIEEDQWFSKFDHLKSDGVKDPILFLGHLIAAVLGDYFVCNLDNREALSRAKNSQIEKLQRRILRDLRLAQDNLPIKDAMQIVQKHCAEANVFELSDFIYLSISGSLNFGYVGDQVVLNSVGTNSIQTVLAVLKNAEKPLHINEITEQCKLRYGREVEQRRVANILHEVAFLYNPGTYGLKKHLALKEEQEHAIRMELERIIEEGEIDRQWHCDELLNSLHKSKPDLATVCNMYTINIILSESIIIRNLGRFVWVRSNSSMDEAVDRKLITDCAVRIVQERGPMTNEALRAAIKTERGLKEGMQIHATKELILIDRGIWGLRDRDVPLSEVQISEMLSELAGVLKERGKPINISQAMDQVVHAKSLSRSLFASLIQLDSRFRFDRTNIHMSAWGASNPHNITDINSQNKKSA